MQPPIASAAGYAQQPTWAAPDFERRQGRLLTRSFVWTGIGFLTAFLLTYAMYYLLQAVDPQRTATGWLIVVAPLVLIATMFMGMFARPKYSGRPVFLQFAFWLFSIAQGVSLGALLYAVSYYGPAGLVLDTESAAPLNLVDVAMAFGLGGLMFAGMAVAGYRMSARGALRLGRLLLVATMVFMAAYLIFSLTLIFSRGGWTGSSWVTLLILALSGLLNLGYIAYMVSMIKQSAPFVEAAGNQALFRSSAIFYGFMMLVNLMGVIRVVLALLARFR